MEQCLQINLALRQLCKTPSPILWKFSVMLLGASARKAALDFPFQAEFYLPSFLNLEADIYQMSCQVTKEIFKDIQKILCL